MIFSKVVWNAPVLVAIVAAMAEVRMKKMGSLMYSMIMSIEHTFFFSLKILWCLVV